MFLTRARSGSTSNRSAEPMSACTRPRPPPWSVRILMRLKKVQRHAGISVKLTFAARGGTQTSRPHSRLYCPGWVRLSTRSSTEGTAANTLCSMQNILEPSLKEATEGERRTTRTSVERYGAHRWAVLCHELVFVMISGLVMRFSIHGGVRGGCPNLHGSPLRRFAGGERVPFP